MDEITKLAEQHILESESHLRHIDEMMARADQSRAKSPIAPDVEAQLAQIKNDRDGLAQELVDIRRQPVDDWSSVAKRGEGLKGLLGTVGLQLEKVLGTIFEPGVR